MGGVKNEEFGNIVKSENSKNIVTEETEIVS